MPIIVPDSSDSDPDLIDRIAKSLFTGILYGNNAEDWDRMPDSSGWPSSTKNWYRCGAEDVLRALRGEA